LWFTKLNVLNTLSIDAEVTGDVVSLFARSAKVGSTPQTTAPFYAHNCLNPVPYISSIYVTIAGHYYYICHTFGHV